MRLQKRKLKLAKPISYLVYSYINLSAVPSTRIDGYPVEKSPDVMKCRAHSIGGDWKSNVQKNVAPVSPVVCPSTHSDHARKENLPG
jgi:hypothetical protein